MSDQYIKTQGSFEGSEEMEAIVMTAFFSDLYSSRQINPDGVWKIHIWRAGENRASITLALSDAERTLLIEQLSGNETVTNRMMRRLSPLAAEGAR